MVQSPDTSPENAPATTAASHNLILVGAGAFATAGKPAQSDNDTHPILACVEGISLWGGVDPQTSQIIDAHHPDHGAFLAGCIVMMPTSRGSCSGSSVLLQLALNDKAPAALIFHQDEDILTLGALVAEQIFDTAIPVFRLCPEDYAALAHAGQASVGANRIMAGDLDIAFDPLSLDGMTLSNRDQKMRDGADGSAMAIAMDIICRIAAVQGAKNLRDVTRGHIDGCILANPANLVFAEKMAAMGARIGIPTTTNAISVDLCNWPQQGVEQDFGDAASRLANSYVAMGAQPTFTCAPYLLESAPIIGEAIGWSESNAVIYANSVLGAHSTKLPDFLDLFVAMTGRAPQSGVYSAEGRRPARIIDVQLPPGGYDESIWPLLGWAVGSLSPDRIPLVRGLQDSPLSTDDLKGMCAAFGTTSGAPMLHIAGHTPDAMAPPASDADVIQINRAALARAWHQLNSAATDIDLVAIGSPHSSLAELQQMAALLDGRTCRPGLDVIVTVGRAVMAEAERDGTAALLAAARVRIIQDICWCSITEPVFPPSARVLMTNSGKYAHYADGLSGRKVRFGGLAACIDAAITGHASSEPPAWAG